MMRYTLLLFAGFLLIALELRAGDRKNEWNLQGSISGSKDHFTFAGAGIRSFGLGKSGRFRIGTGLRYNLAWNQNQPYRTAPARLTSGKTDPSVLFSDDIPANIDTLYAGSTVHSLNALILLEYRITSRLSVGFSIDAVGWSLGPKTTGRFDRIQGQIPTQNGFQAKPSPFNLLLISDNDMGSLNSELYAGWNLTPVLTLRGGATFLFSELQTDQKPALDNDRFRHKSLQAMVGIQYRF